MELDALAPWLLVIKVLLYATALLAAGLSLHVNLGIIESGGRRQAKTYAAISILAALLFTGARLLLVNAQLGGGIEMMLDPASFAWTWRTQGPSALALLAGSAAILAAIPLQIPWISVAGSLGVALSFALTGHGQALDAPGVTPWVVALHVLIASFWFAAPLTLWPKAQFSDIDLSARLERFSRIALIAIPILFGLGIWLAWRLAGGLEQLITSDYGRVLLLKLAVAVLALGVGGLNKLVTTPTLAREPRRGRWLLARSLVVDAMAFGAALTFVAWATTMVGPTGS